MQLNTAERNISLPACARRLGANGELEFSTFHQPAKEQSFYSDFYKVFLENQEYAVQQVNGALSTLRFFLGKSGSQPDADADADALETASVIVDRAKQVTGLSIKDLSGIFHVSRQTLYNYRKSDETINDRNWRRLQAVENEIKVLESTLPYSPGSLIKRITYDGDTLYNLLCSEVLDSKQILKTAKHIASQMEGRNEASVRHPISIDQLTPNA